MCYTQVYNQTKQFIQKLRQTAQIQINDRKVEHSLIVQKKTYHVNFEPCVVCAYLANLMTQTLNISMGQGPCLITSWCDL